MSSSSCRYPLRTRSPREMTSRFKTHLTRFSRNRPISLQRKEYQTHRVLDTSPTQWREKEPPFCVHIMSKSIPDWLEGPARSNVNYRIGRSFVVKALKRRRHRHSGQCLLGLQCSGTPVRGGTESGRSRTAPGGEGTCSWTGSPPERFHRPVRRKAHDAHRDR